MSLFEKSANICLPSQDPDAEARASALARARDLYEYDRSYQGVLLAKALPEAEHFDNRYILHVLGIRAKYAAKSGLLKLEGISVAPGGERPQSADSYDPLYAVIGKPDSVAHRDADWYFAWQRLAGGCPVVIRSIDRMPSNFPVSEAHYRAAVPNDSLAAALAERRVHLCDYALLDRVALGESFGRRRFLWAPMALFAVAPGSGPAAERFVPIAIQCDQTPSASNPIWTPRDGIEWRMAKCVVQTADTHYREIGEHTALCHLIMEAVLLTAHRELAPNHPVLRLLLPHLDQTMATNDVMRRTFISPDGKMVSLQSPSLEGAFDIIHRMLSDFSFDASDLDSDLHARGVGNVESLPWYPYRDDGRPVIAAIVRWVQSYVGRYYGQDADVGSDVELRAWIAALAAPDAGGLKSPAAVETRDQLVRLLAAILWRATGFHSVINNSGWEYLGDPATSPTSAFGPGPSGTQPSQESNLIEMWPPIDIAEGAIEVMYQLGHTQYNTLGHYPSDAFDDPDIAKALEVLRAELDAHDENVRLANQLRPVPYFFLQPHRIPASIHV